MKSGLYHFEGSMWSCIYLVNSVEKTVEFLLLNNEDFYFDNTRPYEEYEIIYNKKGLELIEAYE